MTDYSKLSDFEINKLVAKLSGLNVSAEQYFEPKRNQSNCVLIDNKIKPVDYCNNPSDAWPLMLNILDNGCTIVIDNKSLNGDCSAKTIERKITELYLSIETNKV